MFLFWPFCYLSLFPEHWGHDLLAIAPLPMGSSVWQHEENETRSHSTNTWEGLTWGRNRAVQGFQFLLIALRTLQFQDPSNWLHQVYLQAYIRHLPFLVCDLPGPRLGVRYETGLPKRTPTLLKVARWGSSSFYKRGNRGLELLSGLPKGIHLVNCRTRRYRAFDPCSKSLLATQREPSWNIWNSIFIKALLSPVIVLFHCPSLKRCWKCLKMPNEGVQKRMEWGAHWLPTKSSQAACYAGIYGLLGVKAAEPGKGTCVLGISCPFCHGPMLTLISVSEILDYQRQWAAIWLGRGSPRLWQDRRMTAQLIINIFSGKLQEKLVAQVCHLKRNSFVQSLTQCKPTYAILFHCHVPFRRHLGVTSTPKKNSPHWRALEL